MERGQHRGQPRDEPGKKVDASQEPLQVNLGNRAWNGDKGLIPLELTVWPRKVTEDLPKTHLSLLMARPASCRREKSCRTWETWASCVALAIKMSSRYTKTKGKPRRTLSIRRWNAWAEFLSPKGILRNSYRPKGVTIAVLGMSSSAIGIWWYPRTKSTTENTVAPAVDAVKEWIWGKGYLSSAVERFNCL